MNDRPSINIVKQEALAFPADFQTVQLATSSLQQIPEASYAPYVADSKNYYVYVSELSPHTSNLFSNNLASLLFVEDECRASHVFARRRLTLVCKCSGIVRKSPRFERVHALFRARFGGFMQVLKEMEDFHLFALEPQQGRYIRGFAQAYRFESMRLEKFSHENDKGHRSNKSKRATADVVSADVVSNGVD